jgi:tetratricopeptide (TPR) repeat protein
MLGEQRIGIAMGWRGFGACAAAVALSVALAPAVRAQSNLSERLLSKAAEAQNGDLQRRFGRALVDEGRDLDIDPAAGVDEARQTLVRRASVYETVKDYDKAEADLTSALRLAAPAAVLYLDRGYFYMRRGRFGEALYDFLAAAALEPSNPRPRYAAGRAQAALGNYGEAIDYYGKAIKLGPREPSFYLARAEARLRLEQPGDALADYDRAIDLRPPRSTDRYYAYVGRGYASLMLTDYSDAITSFDSAIQIDPGAVNALLWRGYAREKSGQVDLALEDYERAASVAPNDRSARANVQRLRSN